MNKGLCFIILGLLSPAFPLIGGSPSGDGSAPELAKLRKAADVWLRTEDDIVVRRNADDLFKYIDALIERHETETAVPYLTRVLQAEPWAWDYQLTYAEILASKGQPDALNARAKQAAEAAEKDATIRRAYRLLNKLPPPAPPQLSEVSSAPKQLVIVKVGQISDIWLSELRDALSRRLGIAVTVAELPFDMGPPDRTGLQQMAAAMRRRFTEFAKKDPSFALYLNRNTSEERLQANDDEVFRVMRLIANEFGGNKGQEDVDRQIEQAKARQTQWDADKLIARIHAALVPYMRQGRWFLAVTDKDLFHPGANFLFGEASNDHATGLISAVRFSADFNDEPPNRTRLEARMVKQALSTFGFVLGLPRCTTPGCARAYPDSLSEFDEKSDQLCDACRKAYELALGTSLPTTVK